jgi:hypothetical protein
MTSDIRRIHNELDRGFSAAVVVPLGPKSMIFIAGEIGRDASGAVVKGGFEAEARQCFANIKFALERAGATLSGPTGRRAQAWGCPIFWAAPSSKSTPWRSSARFERGNPQNALWNLDEHRKPTPGRGG